MEIKSKTLEMKNKFPKILMDIGIILGVMILNDLVYAENLEELLHDYLNDDTFDLFGRQFDKIIFRKIVEASAKGKYLDAELIEKIKFVLEDIKTLPLQGKCLIKILQQNDILYLFTLGPGVLNKVVGPKEFTKITTRIMKLMIKVFK